MKKLISLFLAIMMVFSLATVASAVKNTTNGEVNTTGVINVAGATDVYTYEVYKMLHLHTYDNDNGAYTYTIEDKWETFLNTSEAKAYVTIDEGYVTWVGGDAAEFAKLALDYAEKNGIAPEVSTATSTGGFTFTTTGVTFNGLTLGYYLVDTSMGALCALNTTKPEANISVKNGIPTIDKKVEEDSHVGTGTSEFGDSNTADIGQLVNFDVTIDAQAGAQNYVYHDAMDVGLEFVPGSVAVKHHDPDKGAAADKILVENVDYKVVQNPADCTITAQDADWNCSFEVVFEQDFLDTVLKNDKLYITYSAKVTDRAVVGDPGNKNGAVLSYGDNHKTEYDETTTYTYGFEIFKTDAASKPLTGAEFQLLDYNKNPIKVYYNTVTKEYRVGTKTLTNEEERSVIVIENANGIARVKGLDNGTYYLKETKAPNGYTELKEDKSFTISGSNLYADHGAGGAISVGASVHVENNKGVTLPETGAAGTTMFITFGMLTVLGTGVLLVTKKRMSMIED